MNWEDAYKIYEHTKTLHDSQDIRQDITDINNLLSAPLFNSYAARLKITSINEKHKEIFLYMIYYIS